MFTPPETLVQFIEMVQGAQLKLVLPSFKPSQAPDYLVGMISTALEQIYRKKRPSQEIQHRILAAFWEALTNASDHGNQNDERKKIAVGCWFGRRGTLFAFCDEGDFFSQPRTKELVESRTSLPSGRKGTTESDGMLYLYEADRVFVSTQENTLYLAFQICNGAE